MNQIEENYQNFIQKFNESFHYSFRFHHNTLFYLTKNNSKIIYNSEDNCDIRYNLIQLYGQLNLHSLVDITLGIQVYNKVKLSQIYLTGINIYDVIIFGPKLYALDIILDKYIYKYIHNLCLYNISNNILHCYYWNLNSTPLNINDFIFQISLFGQYELLECGLYFLSYHENYFFLFLELQKDYIYTFTEVKKILSININYIKQDFSFNILIKIHQMINIFLHLKSILEKIFQNIHFYLLFFVHKLEFEFIIKYILISIIHIYIHINLKDIYFSFFIKKKDSISIQQLDNQFIE